MLSFQGLYDLQGGGLGLGLKKSFRESVKPLRLHAAFLRRYSCACFWEAVPLLSLYSQMSTRPRVHEAIAHSKKLWLQVLGQRSPNVSEQQSQAGSLSKCKCIWCIWTLQTRNLQFCKHPFSGMSYSAVPTQFPGDLRSCSYPHNFIVVIPLKGIQAFSTPPTKNVHECQGCAP